MPFDYQEIVLSKARRKFAFAISAGTCTYCGKFLESCRWQVDHVKPLSRGGEDYPENIVAACFKCNQAKRSRFLHEWFSLLEWPTHLKDRRKLRGVLNGEG